MTPTVSPSRHDVLRSLPIFAGSTDEELARIEQIVDEIEVTPGEVVLRENETGSESFIVVSGEADVTLAGVRLTTLGAGEFFGEMAVLEGKPRTATVTARTAMHLLVVDGADFPALLALPGVAAHMLRTIVARLREAQRVRPASLVEPNTAPHPALSDEKHVWREPVRGSYPDASWLTSDGYGQLEHFFGGKIPPTPIIHLTGVELDSLSREHATFRMPASDWFLSSQDQISAGALMMLADAALGSGVMLNLPALTPFSTSELSMTFLRPCRAGGVIRATGTSVSDGRPLAISQCWLEDASGERIAFGTSTCFIQPPLSGVPSLPEDTSLLQGPFDTPDPYMREAAGEIIPWDLWRSLSGSEILGRQIAGLLPQPPIHYLTGMTLREASSGRVTFTMPAHKWLSTGLRTVQGGAIAMLAHAALATAVVSTLEPGTAYRPVDVKVNFLRPVFPDDTDLIATGLVTHRGRTLAVATADVVGAGGKKVATATGSTMITPARD